MYLYERKSAGAYRNQQGALYKKLRKDEYRLNFCCSLQREFLRLSIELQQFQRIFIKMHKISLGKRKIALIKGYAFKKYMKQAVSLRLTIILSSNIEESVNMDPFVNGCRKK